MQSGSVFYIVIRWCDRYVKVVLCCVRFVNGDVRYNIDKITSMCGKFADDADLLLFGESFLQGIDGLAWDYEKDVDIAVTQDSPEICEIRAAAARYGISVGFGYMEKVGDKIYSSYMAISETGEIICNYRRMSVGWKVRRADGHYCEGSAPVCFELRGMKCTVALCGDLWTDDVAESIGGCGADLILWPVYTDFDVNEWNSAMKLEYAERASTYCGKALLVNSVCDGEGFAKGGGAYFTDGKIAAETPAGGESVLAVEV